MSNQLILRRRTISGKNNRPPYLKFTAMEDGCTISINKQGSPTDHPIEYSINRSTFVPYTYGTRITLNNRQRIEWRRVEEYDGTTYSTDSTNYYYFTTSGTLVGTGLITSLLKSDCLPISISDYAFINLITETQGLTCSLNLPDTVVTIGDYAFCKCSGLSGNITLSDNITSIGVKAFSECTGFTGDLNIPTTTTLNSLSFEKCTGFTNITCYGWNIDGGCPFYKTGNRTGTFRCIGDITFYGTSSSYNYRGSIAVRTGIIEGNFTCSTSVVQVFVMHTNVNKVSGNYYCADHQVPCGLYTTNGFESFDFLEVCGLCDAILYRTNGNPNTNQRIIHLGYNGIAGNKNVLFATGIWDVNKIYVGDGSSQQNDQAVLDLYLADSDWSELSDILDLWYNYNGEFKE